MEAVTVSTRCALRREHTGQTKGREESARVLVRAAGGVGTNTTIIQCSNVDGERIPGGQPGNKWRSGNRIIGAGGDGRGIGVGSRAGQKAGKMSTSPTPRVPNNSNSRKGGVLSQARARSTMQIVTSQIITFKMYSTVWFWVVVFYVRPAILFTFGASVCIIMIPGRRGG